MHSRPCLVKIAKLLLSWPLSAHHLMVLLIHRGSLSPLVLLFAGILIILVDFKRQLWRVALASDPLCLLIR